MAITASLKNTVRSISVPLSVKCSSGLLIGASFSLPSSHITKICTEGAAVASIHRESEKAWSQKPGFRHTLFLANSEQAKGRDNDACPSPCLLLRVLRQSRSTSRESASHRRGSACHPCGSGHRHGRSRSLCRSLCPRSLCLCRLRQRPPRRGSGASQ